MFFILFFVGFPGGVWGGADLALHIFGAGLRCQVRNPFCGLFGWGADLAQRIFGAGLRCQVRNLFLWAI